MNSHPDFVLTEHLHADRQEVFDAWTGAAALAAWFSPIPGGEVVVSSVGGAAGDALEVSVQPPDGPALILAGSVLEAEAPECLSWELTHRLGSGEPSQRWRLDLRFEAASSGTSLIVEARGTGEASEELQTALEHALGKLPVALPDSIGRFTSTVTRAAQTRSRFGGTWLDKDDAEERMRGRQELGWLDDEDTENLAAFRRDGFLVLEGAVDNQLIARVNADVERAWNGDLGEVWVESFRDQRIEYVTAAPEFRPHPHKLLELHGHSTAARDAIFSPRAQRFLNLLFEGPALAFQSLTFEVGTEQGMHQDTAFVLVSSPLEFVGCWMALEDVTEGSGELQYYRGSHRIDEYLWPGGTRAKPHGYRDDAEFLAWMHEGPRRIGCPMVTFRPKAGDVLLWHADLVHGGGPRTNREVTRRSLVTHLCPNAVDPAWWDSCAHAPRSQHRPGAWTTHRTRF